jgi:hypothetical protein
MKSTALITGASSGLGLEFAHVLASKGINLVLVARNKVKLDAFKLSMEKKYGVIVYNIGKNLSDSNAAKEVYDEIQRKGINIDYLINNASFADYGNFHETNWEKQLHMINVNVVALTSMTRLFLPEMIGAKKGKIMNVASTASFQPGPLMSVYFATKAYVLSFSEAIAHELKGTGVSVTVFCSGAIERNVNSNNSLFKVAEFGYRKMMRGKVVVVPGFVNRVLAHAVRFVPRKIVTSVVRMKIKPI